MSTDDEMPRLDAEQVGLTRGQLRERQVRHAPAHGVRFVVARDKERRFVRVARLFPDTLAVRIAPFRDSSVSSLVNPEWKYK